MAFKNWPKKRNFQIQGISKVNDRKLQKISNIAYAWWGLMMMKSVSQETLPYVSSDYHINLISLEKSCKNAKIVCQLVIWRWQIKTFQGSPNWLYLPLGKKCYTVVSTNQLIIHEQYRPSTYIPVHNVNMITDILQVVTLLISLSPLD